MLPLHDLIWGQANTGKEATASNPISYSKSFPPLQADKACSGFYPVFLPPFYNETMTGTITFCAVTDPVSFIFHSGNASKACTR